MVKIWGSIGGINGVFQKKGGRIPLGGTALPPTPSPRGHGPLTPPPTSSACAFQLFLFGKNRYAVDIFPDGNRQNPRNPSFFSDFFSVKPLANPYKIWYIQKVGLIGALYELR